MKDTLREATLYHKKSNDNVLILVLMEDTLRGQTKSAAVMNILVS